MTFRLRPGEEPETMAQKRHQLDGDVFYGFAGAVSIDETASGAGGLLHTVTYPDGSYYARLVRDGRVVSREVGQIGAKREIIAPRKSSRT